MAIVKHLAVGVNHQAGDVSFQSSKTAEVVFDVAFPQKPSVSITLDDTGAPMIPCKLHVSKTGFKVRFQTPYTGVVSWTAAEV